MLMICEVEIISIKTLEHANLIVSELCSWANEIMSNIMEKF